MWRKQVGPIEFRPSLDGDLLVASMVDGQVVALNLRDGSRRAGQPELGASPSEPFAIGGRVYVGTKDEIFYVAALVVSGRDRGSPADWRRSCCGRVAVTDQHVYFAALDNMVCAVVAARRRAALAAGRCSTVPPPARSSLATS